MREMLATRVSSGKYPRMLKWSFNRRPKTFQQQLKQIEERGDVSLKNGYYILPVLSVSNI